LFANIILADEINRTSPKTQSALLEAMEERQVTLEGETLNLPDPFIVIGTQNPIEYEGTFPLPEAQLDRFLIKASVGYPTKEEEIKLIEMRHQRKQDGFSLEQISTEKEVLEIRQLIEEVYISPKIEDYIVTLVGETRRNSMVAIGASPRGSLALLKLTRARAALEGRAHVLPDDVKAMIEPALVHRLILKPDFWLDQEAATQVIRDVVRSVSVPVLEE
jgi:MoxR-like ATPase